MMQWFLAAALTCVVVTPGMAIELPPEIAKQGSLKVAIVPNYPPLEFRDPATNTARSLASRWTGSKPVLTR
jgi:polar amino acid transport system substrate-binding protein